MAEVDDQFETESVSYPVQCVQAGGHPGHIHYVEQPIDQQAMEKHGSHGPKL